MRLESNDLILEVSLQAAEMHHLIQKRNNREWIWTGDKTFWAGRNPILFPLVGRPESQFLTIDGKQYPTGNHGFTRNGLFSLQYQDERRIILQLTDNEETHKSYPYAFRLEVEYRLKDNQIDILYRIYNLGDSMMPFGFGLHPAFLHSHNGEESIDVRFPCLEKNLPEEILTENGHQVLSFTDAFFEKVPTLQLENVASPYVTLLDQEDEIRISVLGYRYLAFWKKEKAHYLCIEPWHTHGDFPEGIELKDHDGILYLKPGRMYTTSTSLTVKQ